MPRHIRSLRSAAAAVMIAAAVGSGCRAEQREVRLPPVAPPSNATTVAVIDGDTVLVRIGATLEKVRLIGIDTPETKRHDMPVQCFGPEAAAFTAQLLPPGTPLTLERDVVGRDDYARVLAYVYRTVDQVLVNRELVRQGFARLLTIPPNVAHVDDLVAAAHEAQAARRGLWGHCPAVEAAK